MNTLTRLTVAVVLVTGASAQAPKAAPAKSAVPAQPAAPGQPAKPSTLINSDLEGRDLYFIAHSIDIGKAMEFLARQAGRTQNPELRGFGDDLVKSLAAQTAVLHTLAEMRKVNVPPAESASQKAVAAKLDKLSGVKLEKTILDTFIELDRRLIAVCEFGAKSSDPTIAKFVEQTLPQAREHLRYVQTMAGIAPPRPAVVAGPPPAEKPAEAAAQPKPAFRTNIPLQD